MRHVFSNVKKHLSKEEGFSLLEVSITLAILGVLAAASLSLYTDKKHANAAQITRERQELIFKSLANYAIRHGKFPCPSKELDGNAPKTCVHTEGYVPFVTLGLSAKNAQDGRGKPFVYEVASSLTNPPPLPASASSSSFYGTLSDNLETLCSITAGLTTFKHHNDPVIPPENDPIAVALYSERDKKEAMIEWRTRDNLLLQYAQFSCPAYLINKDSHR